ncbi:MAG: hypothetical protein SFY80_17855 [Verrucomicrobiota bacterium]|nr:hypothetical protein [Verrucomicrobiota bacterium]
MKYPMLAHANMAEMKSRHPDWIWNRSDTHVILGVPGSLECFKTPVEPGNSFSPGVGSYGVSTWLSVDGQLYAPEQMPQDALQWRFENGYLPVLTSRWSVGDIHVTSQLFTDGEIELSDIRDYLAVEIKNGGLTPREVSLYLVIRSFGAAGGPIRRIVYEDGRVVINDGPVLFPEQSPTRFGAISYAETKTDIGELLRRGSFPEKTEVKDDSTWASGALEYSVTLSPGAQARYDFGFHVQSNHWMMNWLKPLKQPIHFDALKAAFLAKWERLLPIKLDLPDRRFTEAFQAQLVHLLMFTVSDAPRISPVSYPLWWLRDGAYVVNALNKGGSHAFGKAACKSVAHRDAFGGFGCEGDGPGEVIWILSEHYLLTRDRAFLEEVYPHIKRKAELLMHMRSTATPVKLFNEFCIPQMMLEPHNDLLCTPAKDGLIQGRMDLHFPILWINSFAWLGLTRAAFCARELGLDATAFENGAAAFKEAILAKSAQIFGQNDRDTNCCFWPTGWASKDDAFIQGKFDEFWNKVRCPNGIHTPEPLWTYFEAGQAHNYLLAGHRERAWVSLEMFLTKHTSPGLYTYHEGKDDENSAMLWQRTRGWDDINFVTPHGWTAAEVFLLQRDCLARESGDTLILGTGIPEAWMSHSFSVKAMPTYFGILNYSYDADRRLVEVSIERKPNGGIVADFRTKVEVRIVN